MSEEYGEQVQVRGGLEMFSTQGPEGHTYEIRKDVYSVYACCGRHVLWLLVGIAQPGQKDMLPLVWGADLDERRIDRSADKAVALLRKWREQHGK
jgi:hypothetical protein